MSSVTDSIREVLASAVNLTVDVADLGDDDNLYLVGLTSHGVVNVLVELEDGEVDHLVPERVWQELQRALRTARPSAFLDTLRDCGALARILPEVDALYGVPQRAEFHPEIDAGVHHVAEQVFGGVQAFRVGFLGVSARGHGAQPPRPFSGSDGSG